MTSVHRVVRFVALASLVIAAAAAAVARAGAAAPQQVTVTSSGPGLPMPGATVPMGAVTLNGTGLIVGQVVDAGTNRGVAGAIVSLGGATPGGPVRMESTTMVMAGGGGAAPMVINGVAAGNQAPRVLTDSDGRFVFRNVPKGTFNLAATKAGYLDGAYGRQRPNGPAQALELAEGERDGDVKVRVFKASSIAGTVLDDTGEPVVGASVRAYRRSIVSGRRMLSAAGASATTDDRGMYRIGSLVPGEYVIALPAVQSSVPAALEFTGGLPVELMTSMLAGGGNISLGTGGTQVTPDGKFLLQSGRGSTAQPPTADGRVLVYPTQYYPTASTIAEAAPIVVESGEERGGIDMQLRLVPTSNVSGRLMGPEGPAANWFVRLVPSDTAELSTDPDIATSITDANGDFTFLAVPAGQYAVQAIRAGRSPMGGPQFIGERTVVAVTMAVPAGGGGGMMAPALGAQGPRASTPTLWAVSPVSVSGRDISDLTLTLREGYKVSGSIELIGSSEKPPAERIATIMVLVESADGKQRPGTSSVRFEPNGTFTLPGLLPGKYVLRAANPPGGWTLRSATLGGTDLTDTPFEVEDKDITGVTLTFIDKVSEVAGSVKAQSGSADADAAVVVFPADNRHWMHYGVNPRRMMLRRPGTNGAFSFRPLPAGDYYVIAFSDELAGDWQNPQFLETLARSATRVSVGEGEQRTVELTRQNIRTPAPAPLPAPSFSSEPSWPSSPSWPREADPAADAPHNGTGEYEDEGEDEEPAANAEPPQRDPARPPVPATPQGTRDARPTPAAGTATVSGQVVIDDASSQPARRVRVTLRNPETRVERATATDDTGRFAITGVPAGNYSLTASKAAYLTTYYGSRRPGRGPGTALAVAAGQTLSNLTLRLARGAVIAGTIKDDFGQPLASTPVRLQQFQTVNGVRSLVYVPGGQTSTITDDRGRYRFYGLAPGAYAIAASPQLPSGFGGELRQMSQTDMQAAMADLQRPAAPAAPPSGGAGGRGAMPPTPPQPGVTVGYAPVFYPGTTNNADAGTISVVVGQEVEGVDFAMRYLRVARVEGTVTGSDGRPAPGVQISLQQSVSGTNVINYGGLIRTDAEGKFTAMNVTPGQYTLLARGGGGGRGAAGGRGATEDVIATFRGAGGGAPVFVSGGPTAQYASVDLTVTGEDISNIALTLQDGMTVSGRVTAAGSGVAAPLDLTQVNFSLLPAPQSTGAPTSPSRAGEDGRFTMTGIVPGRYVLRLSMMGGRPGWFPRSAKTGGHDVLDVPLEVRPGQNITDLEVTLTDSLAEVAGTLIDGAGRPAPGFTILVFTTNRDLWAPGSRRLAAPAQPASDGKFRVTGLPPGEYYMAAVTDLEPGEWGDQSFMDAVAAVAFKITLRDGEKKVQDLKIAG